MMHILYCTFLSSFFSMYYSHTLLLGRDQRTMDVLSKKKCFAKCKRRTRSILIGSDQKYLGRRDVRNIGVRFAQTHVRFTQTHNLIRSSSSPSFLLRLLRYFTIGILKKIQGAVSYIKSTVYWVN